MSLSNKKEKNVTWWILLIIFLNILFLLCMFFLTAYLEQMQDIFLFHVLKIVLKIIIP